MTPAQAALELPEARDLFRGLGLYWTRMRSDADMTASLCLALTLLAEHCRRRLGEARDSLDRRLVPTHAVSPRRPCVVSLADRDSPASAGAWMGMDPPLHMGPQPDGSVYGKGFELSVGGAAPREGWHSYVLRDAPGVVGAAALADLPVKPTVALEPGSDFTLSGGLLSVAKGKDPFESGRYMRRSAPTSDGMSVSREAVLWLVDAMEESGAVDELYGFAARLPLSFGVRRRKAALNAFMDLRVGGFSPAAVERCVRECMDGGSFRIYRKLSAADGVSARKALSADVPVVYFSEGVSGCPGGLMAEWAESPLVSMGGGCLAMSVQPMGMDADRYWRGVWDRFDAMGVSQEAAYGPAVAAMSPVPGASVGKLSPAGWLVSSLLRSLSVLVVDAGMSERECDGASALSQLAQYAPAHTHMMIVLKMTLGALESPEPCRQRGVSSGLEVAVRAEAFAGQSDLPVMFHYSRRTC